MATSGARAASQRLGVVTVSYRSDTVLPGFLASVAASSSLPIVVVVADNLPGEGAARSLAESAGADYLAMEANVGYGSAMNAAIKTLPADIEWVLISNPDVVLMPGVLDGLREAGDESIDIASVGPAIHSADGTLYPSARVIPSLRTGVGHAMFTNLWPNNPWSRKYLNETEAATKRNTGWLSGACVLVRRGVFDEIGGFDPDYFMYVEDLDLGYRFGQHGYRNVYEPSVRVIHSGAHSTKSESAVMIAAHHKSARRFLAKKYPGAILWPVRVVLNIGLSVRSAIIGRRIRRQERAL